MIWAVATAQCAPPQPGSHTHTCGAYGDDAAHTPWPLQPSVHSTVQLSGAACDEHCVVRRATSFRPYGNSESAKERLLHSSAAEAAASTRTGIAAGRRRVGLRLIDSRAERTRGNTWHGSATAAGSRSRYRRDGAQAESQKTMAGKNDGSRRSIHRFVNEHVERREGLALTTCEVAGWGGEHETALLRRTRVRLRPLSPVSWSSLLSQQG